MNQCMGCQSGWPLKWHAVGAPAYHCVVGGYPGERVACTKEKYDISTSGHGSLGEGGSRTCDWSANAPAVAPRVHAAFDPAEGKDQTFIYSTVTEEDFALMLEVDRAYIKWLETRIHFNDFISRLS
jgi:hypothetical protein